MTRARIADLRIKLRLGQPVEDIEVEALIDALERSELTVQLFNNGTGGELWPMVRDELAKTGRL